MKNEINEIIRLTGCDEKHIELNDTGFLSRVYIINGGEIVFKFPRSKDTKYDEEIKSINYFNTLNLKVNLQRVKWTGEDNSYLGLTGIIGTPLNRVAPENYNPGDIAKQISTFAKTLHTQKPDGFPTFTMAERIADWQSAYLEATGFFKANLTPPEYALLDRFIMNYVPDEMNRLGDNPVFSHGDLNSGNIIIDNDGKVGIIDCAAGYEDQSVDLANLTNLMEISDIMLDEYGADEALRHKVKLRQDTKPARIMTFFLKRNELDDANSQLRETKRILAEYKDRIK